jgi:hypothetical protein
MTDEYMKSVREIFEMAMQNGDLRVALQAKILEGRCRGLLNAKHKTNTDLDTVPTAVLMQIMDQLSQTS